MKESKTQSYDLTVKSSTSQLATIRSFIQEHAEDNNIPAKVIQSLILAVDEAATNIVKHAYHYNTESEIVIHFEVQDVECCITLSDFGDSFDPSLIPEPDMQEYFKQHKVGGLGLYLIRTLMDSMEYKSDKNHRNQLIMRKRFA